MTKLRPAIFLAGALTTIINAQETVDLYIRERYQTSANELCGYCEERDDCFLTSRMFYLENGCRSRGRGRSSAYGQVAGEEGTVCREDFDVSCEEDNPPSFGATSLEECGQTWPLNECENSLKMVVLEDWCIFSDEPVGEHTTPFVHIQNFDSAEACGTSDYTSLMFPVDEDLCILGTYVHEDESRSHGSRRLYCDGDTFLMDMYENRECSGTGTPHSDLSGITGECPSTSDAEVFVGNCGSHTVYCKHLYDTDFGMQLSAPLESDAGTEDNAEGVPVEPVGEGESSAESDTGDETTVQDDAEISNEDAPAQADGEEIDEEETAIEDAGEEIVEEVEDVVEGENSGFAAKHNVIAFLGSAFLMLLPL